MKRSIGAHKWKMDRRPWGRCVFTVRDAVATDAAVATDQFVVEREYRNASLPGHVENRPFWRGVMRDAARVTTPLRLAVTRPTS